jgi:hypothetical protein
MNLAVSCHRCPFLKTKVAIASCLRTWQTWAENLATPTLEVAKVGVDVGLVANHVPGKKAGGGAMCFLGLPPMLIFCASGPLRFWYMKENFILSSNKTKRVIPNRITTGVFTYNSRMPLERNLLSNDIHLAI